MNRVRTYWIIFAIFVLGLAINIVLFLSQNSALPGDLVVKGARQIMSVYSVHLGIILAGVFGGKGLKAPAPRSQVTLAAICLTLLWNGLVIWGVASFALAPTDAPDAFDNLVDYLKTLPADSAFLVSGMLTFLFVREGKAEGDKSVSEKVDEPDPNVS